VDKRKSAQSSTAHVGTITVFRRGPFYVPMGSHFDRRAKWNLAYPPPSQPHVLASVRRPHICLLLGVPVVGPVRAHQRTNKTNVSDRLQRKSKAVAACQVLAARPQG
jgi:hypothetical protein